MPVRSRRSEDCCRIKTSTAATYLQPMKTPLQSWQYTSRAVASKVACLTPKHKISHFTIVIPSLVSVYRNLHMLHCTSRRSLKL